MSALPTISASAAATGSTNQSEESEDPIPAIPKDALALNTDHVKEYLKCIPDAPKGHVHKFKDIETLYAAAVDHFWTVDVYQRQ